MEAFERNNLVLVDEAASRLQRQRGQESGCAVAELRAEGSFEVLCTFGQAASAAPAGWPEPTRNLFDYLYKYFYNDGYGKEYRSSTSRTIR